MNTIAARYIVVNENMLRRAHMIHQGPPPGWGWNGTGNVMLHEHDDGWYVAPRIDGHPVYACSRRYCRKALRSYTNGRYAEELRATEQPAEQPLERVAPEHLDLPLDLPGAVTLEP